MVDMFLEFTECSNKDLEKNINNRLLKIIK